MKYINWNIKCYCDINKIIDFHVIYSLDYRKPDDEFDTDNRRLGVMLLIS